MFQFFYFLFWVLLIRIVWAKRQNFFWPIFVGIIATPFVGIIWAIMMDDRSERRRIFN